MTKTLSEQRKRAEGESVSVPVKSELSRQLCEIVGLEKPVDFEQPENFVKLFNLDLVKTQSPGQTLATLITKKFEFTVDSRHFISQIMRLIQYAFYYQVDVELIKQSIRNYDGWVWG